MPALSSDRIRTLFSAFREHDPHQAWRIQYSNAVARVQGYDKRALRTPEAQEDLWSARDLATIGPGDAVNVRAAFTDPEVIEAVATVREQDLPKNPQDRAAAVDLAYRAIIVLVHPRLSKKRPWTRLARLFAALLPRDVHCCFTSASRASVNLLLLDERDDSVGSAVLARARLREALGPESDLDDDVWRSVFCWWLHENVATLRRGEDPPLNATAVPSEDAPLPEPLKIAPAHRLRKGIWGIKGGMPMIRLIVETAQGGASVDDIIETLRDIHGDENLALGSARRCVNRVRLLGIIENRGGLFHPSEVGDRLLNDPRPDALVEHLLTTTFGLGHYIRHLAEGPLPRAEALSNMQAIHPTWTTTMMPMSIEKWARSLGLVRRHEGKVELTEYGEEWESRLPAVLEVPPRREVDDDDDDDENDNVSAGHPGTGKGPGPRFRTDRAAQSPQPAPPTPPSLAALDKAIAAAAPDFVVRPDLLRALHLAWHSIPTKRFVIFSGLSGTGKTALLNRYAEAYCSLMGLDVRAHRAVTAVAPDWRDPSSLLGYFNALHADPTYQREPALRLLLAAARDPGRPYFLILDEMNLARVEHYFAPFLSAMETADRLVLHAHEETINGVPPTITWPHNLFIGGTVNMDETTHAISDKVLDRAFTIEFWEVDLNAYFDRRAKERPSAIRHSKAEALLLALGEQLKPVRRHFGYRSAREVLAFLDAGVKAGLDTSALAEALDQAVFSKILPRIRGEESEPLLRALTESARLCAKAGLSRSEAKLRRMHGTLQSTGLTHF